MQGLAYAALMGATIKMAAEEPDRAASRSRSDLGVGLRSLHMSVAARRRHAARHVIYYRAERDPQRVVILRVLHDAMDPAGRVKAALSDDLRRS